MHQPSKLDAGTQSPVTGLPGNGLRRVARIQPAELRGDAAAETAVERSDSRRRWTDWPTRGCDGDNMAELGRDDDGGSYGGDWRVADSSTWRGNFMLVLPGAWLLLTTLAVLNSLMALGQRLDQRFLESSGVEPGAVGWRQLVPHGLHI